MVAVVEWNVLTERVSSLLPDEAESEDESESDVLSVPEEEAETNAAMGERVDGAEDG